MATSGVKVSRIGFDVNTASDKQLAFSSEWPLLPIEAEGDLTINPPVGGPGMVNQDIFTHNLGYEPVFYIQRADGGNFWPGWCWINSSKLWFNGYVTVPINVKWKIFRRPLKTNYTSKNTNIKDATQVIDKDYGILISRPGKSIASNDKRDFGVRSDVRQLMIAQSGFTDTPVYEKTVTHNLGFRPMFFLFIESDSTPGDYAMATSASDFYVTATDTRLTWRLYTPPNRNYAYIIFKDTLTTNG